MLTLVYNSPVKVDTREDWQKSGKYRYCHACVSDVGGKECFQVVYCEWGKDKIPQYIEGFSSYAEAQLHAKGMNIKENKE